MAKKNTTTKQSTIAYTDGSYTNQNGTEVVGYGIVFFNTPNDTTPSVYSGITTNHLNQRNILGELMAVYTAIQKAIKQHYKQITIYHDYTGVAEWAENRWQAKNPLTQTYKQAIVDFRKQIEITFVKVKGHSGDKWNEEADKAANNAIKNYLKASENSKPALDEKHPLVIACLAPADITETPVAQEFVSAPSKTPVWNFGKWNATPINQSVTNCNQFNNDLIAKAIKQTEELLQTLKQIQDTTNNPAEESAADILELYSHK